MGLRYPAWIATEEKTGKVMIQMCDFPYCCVGGDNLEDAKSNLIDVLKDEVLEDGTLDNGFLHSSYFEQNRPVPLPSSIEDVPNLNFLEMDIPASIIEFPEDMSKQIWEHNECCTGSRA